jgi:transcriptional regulator with XRE-family HTH domain
MVAWALLQEARRRSGLTQAELARRAGVPQSTVAKIERGRRDPSLSTLERLVRAAGLELRIQLAPHDHHDLQLIDLMLDLTPEERLQSLEHQLADFADVEVLSGRR